MPETGLDRRALTQGACGDRHRPSCHQERPTYAMVEREGLYSPPGLSAPPARDGDIPPARSVPDSPAMLLAPVHLFNTSLPKERPLTTCLCFLLSNPPCSL